MEKSSFLENLEIGCSLINKTSLDLITELGIEMPFFNLSGLTFTSKIFPWSAEYSHTNWNSLAAPELISSPLLHNVTFTSQR